VGVISSGISMIADKYSEILYMASNSRSFTLNSRLRKEVNECMRSFMPLSYKMREITVIRDSYRYPTHICMCSWLRRRNHWQKLGKIIDDGFDYFRMYGDEMVKYVRRPIREDFSEAIRLVKELREYDNISEFVEVPEVDVYLPMITDDDDKLILDKITVYGIETTTKSPNVIILRGVDGDSMEGYFMINNYQYISAIEDIIDYVYTLYRQLYSNVVEKNKWNEERLRKLRDITEPYKVAKNL